ncbi:unnamed protein product [Linum tenue]|uniref:Bet v I/Major latex protein domain-containing protein n=1 Tax=Linum tenue TaxID=586396 RepID=A0AAV0NP36_9ROSI|nr:unnamed protein product [Linum tenue]
MAQLQKLETKAPMKSPEKIAAFFRDSFTSLPQLLPDLFKTAEIVGGGRKAGPGSVMLFQYSLPGSPLMSAKIKWELEEEAMDDTEEGKKSFTLTVIEGEVLGIYKSFGLKIEMDTEAGQSGWVIHYELANPNAAPPHAYIEVWKQLAKALDKYC